MYAKKLLGGDPAVWTTGLLGSILATGSTLLNGLVSYWPLDEESGTRYDSVGDNDLTDNNTVGYDTGVNGNAASFVAANSEMLTKSPLLTFDQSAHTIAGWAKLNSMGNDIITYLTGNGGRTGVYVYTSGGKIALARYVIYDGGGYRVASVNVDIPFNTWFFFVVDADGENARISVNNGTPGSAAAGFAVPDTNFPTVLGALAASQNYLDGQLDEVAIWNRVLTADERAELYNSGAGKFYPFS